MIKNKLLVEVIGWYGAVAILSAYSLNTLQVIDAGSIMYQILNLTGAIGIVVVSVAKGAKQPAVLNIAWAIVALLAIIGIIPSF